MRTQTKTVICRMALSIGLAIAATAALIYWISAQAPDVWASTSGPAREGSSRGDIGVTWTSTTPVTTTVGQNESKVWIIATYDMTVTFYLNSVSWPAVFTFTPESGYSIGGAIASSHFFRLEGRYEGGGTVSLNDVKIELQYSPAELNGAREHTLNLYHYDLFTDVWAIQDKEAFVDPEANLLSCKTNETGLFGVGGYRNLTLLPIVSRSYD